MANYEFIRIPLFELDVPNQTKINLLQAGLEGEGVSLTMDYRRLYVALDPRTKLFLSNLDYVTDYLDEFNIGVDWETIKKNPGQDPFMIALDLSNIPITAVHPGSLHFTGKNPALDETSLTTERVNALYFDEVAELTKRRPGYIPFIAGAIDSLLKADKGKNATAANMSDDAVLIYQTLVHSAVVLMSRQGFSVMVIEPDLPPNRAVFCTHDKVIDPVGSKFAKGLKKVSRNYLQGAAVSVSQDFSNAPELACAVIPLTFTN